MEIEVRQGSFVAWLTLPDDRGLVSARPLEVAVHAIDARVECSTEKPLRVWRLPVEHAIPRPGPLELASKTGPERFRITIGFRVDRLVAGGRALLKLARWHKRAVFSQQIVVLGGFFRIGHRPGRIAYELVGA